MSAVFVFREPCFFPTRRNDDGCWHRVLPMWTLSIYTYDILKYGHCQDEKEVL